MTVFKCKMCGGEIEKNKDHMTAKCGYCGSEQTLPELDDKTKANLYDRADHFRRNHEFDKAMGIYKKILDEYGPDPEIYWSLVLCRYGIEYIQDMSSGKYVPYVNRMRHTPVFADEDYRAAVENADGERKRLYEEEAARIYAIQKDIMRIAQEQKAFDVFICYRENDDNGRRTRDSVLAGEIYRILKGEGLRVFFSRVTLEDVFWQDYEPHIFAALDSSKVMIVLGTREEYFNSVWVKNEWIRYLEMTERSEGKRTLIPVYKDMDPYDIPDELSHLRALDMSRPDFMQQLLREIKMFTGADRTGLRKDEDRYKKHSSDTDTYQLMKEGNAALLDKEWERADAFFKEVADRESENAEAYLGRLMAELRCIRKEELGNCTEPFDKNGNYEKIMDFGSRELKEELEDDIEHINRRNERERLERLYEKAINTKNFVDSIEDFADSENAFIDNEGRRKRYEQLAEIFGSFKDFRDSERLYSECTVKAEAARQGALKGEGSVTEISDAGKDLKDKESGTEEDIAENGEKKSKKKKMILSLIIILLICIVTGFMVHHFILAPKKYDQSYNEGMALAGNGKYMEAVLKFDKVKGFKDSSDQIIKMRKLIGKGSTICTGAFYTVGVKDDGTVVATDFTGKPEDYFGQCDVGSWSDITAVSAGYYHTAGLKNDGTVVAAGFNEYGACDVSGWTDIVAISAGGYHTVGLKSDGTVVAAGYNEYGACNVSDWTDIVAVSAGWYHTVGLKSDGTVVAAGYNEYGECDVDDWKEIIAVSAGGYDTIGLKADGTVTARGYNEFGRCDVEGWTGITAISAGNLHTTGLRSDGTVVATGNNDCGECDVSDWTDIVAISAKNVHTAGLKKDGTVVATEYKGDPATYTGQCEVGGWTGIRAPKII